MWKYNQIDSKKHIEKSTHEVHFDCKYQKLDFRKKRKVNSQWFKSCCQTCVHAQSLQSCPTLCYPMDCSPPGSSTHEVSQARILEWVAISFSRGSSLPRNRTQLSSIADRLVTISVTRELRLSQVFNFIKLNYPQVHRSQALSNV